MKSALFFVLSLGTLAVCATMTTPGTQSQDEQQLRNIEAQLAKFEQQNDVSMMSLTATNFVFVGKKVISRKGLEEGVKHSFTAHGNGPNPYTIERKDMQVYLFGDTAVVTYVKEYRQTPDTSKFIYEDTTDVFKKDAKGWLWQFSKTSPVASAPAN